MNSEWQETLLANLLTFANGKTSPSRLEKFPYPVFGSNGIIGYSEEVNTSKSSIIIGRVGSYCGSVYFSDSDCWVTDNAIYALPKGENDPKFFYYLLSNLNLNQWRSGSGQPLLNQSILNSISVKVPSSQTQQAIADILNSLDEKIELNRQMSKTLEDIASTLFKSWFINFDPVKAKAAGREPEGLSSEIAALFPDSFVDSSLGQIPKGWEISEIGNILRKNVNNIKASQETENLPYVPIDCITSNTLALQNYQSGKLAKTSLVKFAKGEILFGSMRPYFHKVCIAPFAGVTRTTAFVLSPFDLNDFSFGLMTIFRQSTIEFASNTAQGSTIPYAVWDGVLAKMQIILPPRNLRIVYNQIITKSFDKILNISIQNRNLCNIRYFLFPKLITGVLKIKNLEPANVY